jgi:hypothetical protein
VVRFIVCSTSDRERFFVAEIPRCNLSQTDRVPVARAEEKAYQPGLDLISGDEN